MRITLFRRHVRFFFHSLKIVSFILFVGSTTPSAQASNTWGLSHCLTDSQDIVMRVPVDRKVLGDTFTCLDRPCHFRLEKERTKIRFVMVDRVVAEKVQSKRKGPKQLPRFVSQKGIDIGFIDIMGMQITLFSKEIFDQGPGHQWLRFANFEEALAKLFGPRLHSFFITGEIFTILEKEWRQKSGKGDLTFVVSSSAMNKSVSKKNEEVFNCLIREQRSVAGWLVLEESVKDYCEVRQAVGDKCPRTHLVIDRFSLFLFKKYWIQVLAAFFVFAGFVFFLRKKLS